ncbi:hypothetical protein ACE103_10080 [Bradyrhizobium sp. ma5]|uniref:hypothetical protein n=1 Tax=Bradyrhizobium sp. ma5 TaxID=3344828 RepID=UPI0035D51DAC
MKNPRLMTLGDMGVYSPGVLVQHVEEIADPETTCPVDLIEFRLAPFAASTPHSHPSQRDLAHHERPRPGDN